MVSLRFNLVVEIGVIIVVLTLEAVLLSSLDLPLLNLAAIMAASGASLSVVPFVTVRRISARSVARPTSTASGSRREAGTAGQAVHGGGSSPGPTNGAKSEARAGASPDPAKAQVPTGTAEQIKEKSGSSDAVPADTTVESKRILERLEKIDYDLLSLSTIAGSVLARLPIAQTSPDDAGGTPKPGTQRHELRDVTPVTEGEKPSDQPGRDGGRPKVVRAIKAEAVESDTEETPNESLRVKSTGESEKPQRPSRIDAPEELEPTSVSPSGVTARTPVRRRSQLSELEELTAELVKLRSKFDNIGLTKES